MTNLPDAALREVVIRLQATVETLDKTVGRLVDGMVSREAHEALKDRVEAVEGVIQWLSRIIIGAVILALLGLVIVQGGGAK